MTLEAKRAKLAETLELEIEDICHKCGEDEIFNDSLCVACEEETE
jgi:hypothetical protein